MKDVLPSKLKQNQYIYAKEKICYAIYCLATGEDEIRTRLFYATIRLHVLNREECLPHDLREYWFDIWGRLTRFGIKYSGSGKEMMGPIEHTMKRIRKKTAREIAEDLYDLKSELEEY